MRLVIIRTFIRQLRQWDSRPDLQDMRGFLIAGNPYKIFRIESDIFRKDTPELPFPEASRLSQYGNIVLPVADRPDSRLLPLVITAFELINAS